MRQSVPLLNIPGVITWLSNALTHLRSKRLQITTLFILALAAGFLLTGDSLAQDVEVDVTEGAEQVEAAAQDAKEAVAAQDDVSQDAAGTELAVEVSEPVSLDSVLSFLSGWVFFFLFFDVLFSKGPNGAEVPFLIVFLAAGAIFFTIFHGFINLRGFKHAIDIVRGKYSSDDDDGDVPPFQALTSALSATVGLGNIAGVAIAVKMGGPGAVFWMMVLGLFGMTAKFHESTLGQLFRVKNPDGTMSGGAMYYLDHGIAQTAPSLKYFGKVLAIVFAVFCIGGAVGGGNMFQANQAFEGFFTTFVSPSSTTLAEKNRAAIEVEPIRELLTDNQLLSTLTIDDRSAFRNADEDVQTAQLAAIRSGLELETVRRIALPSQIETQLPEDDVKTANEERADLRFNTAVGFGLLLSAIVGMVVIGGIQRIGAATSKIVPVMCIIYVVACLVVIFANVAELPRILRLIVTDAFAMTSVWGGLLGVLIIGFQRAAFSSEAGLGSSAIAHSAAKQKEPVREGFVASLEPFIDTIVICFMTSLVVLVTGAYIAPELAEESNGTAVTLYAFQQKASLASWFPYVLSISVILFAFSTMISWCYYGERAWGYLFGFGSLLVFRIIFVVCVFIGSIASLGAVVDFSDAMLLSMALPNIIGGIILAPLVRRKLKDYWARYKADEFETTSF